MKPTTHGLRFFPTLILKITCKKNKSAPIVNTKQKTDV
ncbi:MAG: CRISPR-associated DxTHG motif protein [Ruminococcaceae bacterium]|nr:CRISPR-associated DxTHG motif protein [Oscillospiraceae bacterium]